MKDNKFNAKKQEIDGILFDSGLEAKRYLFLKEAQARGEIRDLCCHESWELLPNQYATVLKQLKTKTKEVKKLIERRVVYSCDFAYFKGEEYVVEDCKPGGRASRRGNIMVLSSRDYPLRRKMLRYFHGLGVREITKWNEPI